MIDTAPCMRAQAMASALGASLTAFTLSDCSLDVGALHALTHGVLPRLGQVGEGGRGGGEDKSAWEASVPCPHCPPCMVGVRGAR